MENRKSLFKAQSRVLSPRNHIEINRERQRVARNKIRDDLFQSNRIISISPTPSKSLTKTGLNRNCSSPTPANIDQKNPLPVTMGTSTNKMSKRQANYLQRFLKWKAADKHQAPQKKAPKHIQPSSQTIIVTGVEAQHKRRSIYVVDSKAENTGSNTTNSRKLPDVTKLSTVPMSTQLASANKHLSADATNTAVKNNGLEPVKLKNPLPNFVSSDAVMSCPKNPLFQDTNSTALMKPNQLPTVENPKSLKMPATIKPLSFGAAPAAASGAVTCKPLTNSVKPSLIGRNILSAEINHKTIAPKRLTKPPQDSDAKTKAVKPSVKSLQLSSRLIKEKPKVKADPKSNPSTTTGFTKTLVGSVSNESRPLNLKTRAFEIPKPNNIKSLRSGAAQLKTTSEGKIVKSNLCSQLSTRMKAKKPAPLNSKQKQVRQTSLIKIDLLQATTDLQTPNTSLYVVSNKHLFKAQATSTECKSNNCSTDLVEDYGDISEIIPATVDKPNETASFAKRQLLALSPRVTEPLPMGSDGDMTMLATTPLRNAECQSISISPFVTVSRGKENSRAELHNRNNKYRQSLGLKKLETPVSVRHKLESVAFFRMQLDNEIRRLHSLCDEWYLYINQNEARLQQTGGRDLIDAAVGQTKLLTSKKFMQFKSLIDRCEAGALGVNLKPNDGSEATKPVFVEDLEGWWDMLRLQSKNVDKRFDNLLRLKANDWLDPDASAVPKTMSKVGPNAKQKPAVKASRDLKSFLRKAFADKRKNQKSEALPEKNIQQNLTPTRQHRVILVRDRKSFSPARTVLRVANGGDNRPSIGMNILLKSAIMGAAEQISRQQMTPSSGPPVSILKTPGTKKRESGARVIFSAKKKVRRFQFTFDEGNVSGDEAVVHDDKLEDREEDMTPERSSSQTGQHVTLENREETDGHMSRAYLLRNRKVNLRPSSEFM